MTVVGEKIKDIRLKHGYTQKELSEMSGVSEISIRKYEKGDRIPKIDKLNLIANALGENISVFTDDSSFNIVSEQSKDLRELGKDKSNLLAGIRNIYNQLIDYKDGRTNKKLDDELAFLEEKLSSLIEENKKMHTELNKVREEGKLLEKELQALLYEKK